jgi:hypothetical protein
MSQPKEDMMPSFTFSQPLQLAWSQGTAAYADGQPITACPAIMNDDLCAAWRAGWSMAHEDATYEASNGFTDEIDDSWQSMVDEFPEIDDPEIKAHYRETITNLDKK